MRNFAAHLKLMLGTKCRHSEAGVLHDGYSDHIGGILLLAHSAKMQRIDKEELERLIAEWRADHSIPEEIGSREQAFYLDRLVLQFLDLSELDLSKLDLRPLRLVNCNLQGCKLNAVRMDGTMLFGCDLSDVESWESSFRSTDFRQCCVARSRFMHGHFEGASFAHSNLEHSKLIGSYHDKETWFYSTRLYCTDLSESRLEGVNLAEARTLYGVRLHRARLDGAEINYDLFETKIGEELAREFVKASESYTAIRANLESRGYSRKAGYAFVKERQTAKMASAPWNSRRCYGARELGDRYEYSQELKKNVLVELGARSWEARTWWFYFTHVIKWLSDWTVELLCGYGESVWRVLFWMLAIVLAIGPGFIGLSGGLEWTGNNIETYNHLPTVIQKQSYGYFQYVLYLIDAFTTANFSPLRPANDLVRLVSGIVALSGIFLTGLLGFVAGNRIRRS